MTNQIEQDRIDAELFRELERRAVVDGLWGICVVVTAEQARNEDESLRDWITRLRKPTIVVNGRTVPAGMVEAPTYGQKVYIPQHLSCGGERIVELEYRGHVTDYALWKLGVLYDNESDALTRGEAELAKGEGE